MKQLRTHNLYFTNNTLLIYNEIEAAGHEPKRNKIAKKIGACANLKLKAGRQGVTRRLASRRRSARTYPARQLRRRSPPERNDRRGGERRWGYGHHKGTDDLWRAVGGLGNGGAGKTKERERGGGRQLLKVGRMEEEKDGWGVARVREEREKKCFFFLKLK